MALVNAEQQQTVFAEWMKACHDVTDVAVVAIDGKTLRGCSYCFGKGKGAIHIISAFSAANGVVLGKVKTAEKSYEITAIPELLKLLSLQGCLVTIDTMGCQKKIAIGILQKGADYLLSVKANQPSLSMPLKPHSLCPGWPTLKVMPMSQMRKAEDVKKRVTTLSANSRHNIRSLALSGLD